MDSTISYAWQEDGQTLLFIHLRAGWTMAGYAVLASQLIAGIKQLSHHVDVIVRVDTPPTMPTGSAVSHLRQLTRMVPSNVQTIVIVTQHPFVRTVNIILFQVMPKARASGALASSIEEAYAIIAERRAQRQTR
jgi:hypothetical protein